MQWPVDRQSAPLTMRALARALEEHNIRPADQKRLIARPR
jgi:hypothetical protein